MPQAMQTTVANLDGETAPRAPAPVAAILIAGGLLAAISVEPLLIIAAFATLAFIVQALWRPGEPPVLLFVLCFQWVQVTTKLLYCSYLGVSLADYSHAEEIIQALALSLIGLTVLSAGIAIVTRNYHVDVEQMSQRFSQISTVRAFQLYVAASIVSSFLVGIAYQAPSLTQPLLALAQVKWVAFFVFACSSLVQHKSSGLLMAAIGLEVVIGVTGFFSDFKQVLFIGFIAALTARSRVSAWGAVFIAILVAASISIAVVWSAVKPQYRSYLNQGTDSQTVVVVDIEDRLTTLGNLIMAQDGESLGKGAEALVMRLGYIDYFSYALRFVPAYEPHTDGAMWQAALAHVFMPRVLFPDKEALPNDSYITMRYTGVRVRGENTSVSVGYMAENYIDFAVPGMFVSVFILGCVFGLLYTNILNHLPTLFAYPAAVVSLIPASSFETALPKIVGSVVMTFIVMKILLTFAAPRLEAYLHAEAAPSE
ncbi:MAG: hypothetical protein ACKVP4_14415 [Hyphomicrobium sp.]